jgi:hypothetical protein
MEDAGCAVVGIAERALDLAIFTSRAGLTDGERRDVASEQPET